MTSEGFKKAKEYLKEIGRLEEFENNLTSVDGYSLVHFANHCKAEVIKEISENEENT